MPWIANPFGDPLFFPVAWRVGGILLIVLVLLVFLAKKNNTRLVEDVLFKRWLSWLAISVILITCLLSGSLPFLLLLAALIVQGLREYASLVALPPLYRRVLLALGCAIPVCAFLSTELFFLAVPVFLMLATVQPLRSFPTNPNAVRDLAFAVLGWGYIAWFLSHLMLVQREVIGGTGLLLAVLAAVAFSDVGAYLFGRTFGKTKLAPNISPNKTRAGAVGNFAGAYVAFGLMAFALPSHLPLFLILALPALIAVGSLWGDLFESVLKREFSTKDAGDWLPGFGGLLDRIDSLILVAPILYYSLRLAS